MKPHLEFMQLEMDSGWETPPGYPADSPVKQKVLASDLDETVRKGSRTRLLRFGAGDFTRGQITHDHWEEVYLVSGDIIVGEDADSKSFVAPTYCCRPPGVPHGPFKSVNGCVLYEIHYYA